MHKESGQVVAIKQVPVDTDLQEIIKEISMMQQCDRSAEIVAKLLIIFNLLVSPALHTISQHRPVFAC